ncbi:dihydrolipoamide acetyltransferase family protein [Sphingobium sp.]|uniref:dihydrolipoamide acetyltransferase family protein n=1 Tax=Sphingobium sp. TaxID=1912891 RepID=UPI0039C95D04
MEQPERLPSTEAGPILPVRLPDVGEGVTEAELVEWHVKVGDDVQEDQLLAAVMTDKATVEIPSLYAGKVVQLGGDIGAVLAVGANLVLIETKTAAAPQGIEMPKPPPSKAPSPAAPPPVPLSAADDAGRPLPARASIAQSGAPRSEGSPVLASPSVRARARENGIDLRQVAGSGPAGRITHDDLDGIFAAPAGAGVTRTSSSRGPRTASTQIKVVGMRRKIAERMALANSRIPHITVIEEVDVTALEELRERLNAGRGDKPKLTLLPFVTAALSRAFVDHPEMNAHFDDEAGVVTRHGPVHLGIATMTDAGLVVPVLRHAEALRLWESAAEIARLSSVARAGKANRDELSGSTFTITSLGPLGAIATTPIINHPEVAILGINKMAVRPMWDGSQFQPRKMMNISASFDHRVIDGWDAAVFVQKMKSLLETPTLIFLDQNA